MSREQKTTLLVAVTTAFLTTFMSSSLNLSIPNIEKEFTAGAAVVGWVVSVYMFAVSAINVPIGKVADSVGRRKILITGIAVFTVACVVSSFSSSIYMLLAMRLLQGGAGAMLFATNNAILLSAFPPEKHGSALGKSVAATYTGLSLGPVIGGVLNHNLGWRSIFVAAAIIGVTALLLAIKGLPREERHESKHQHDYAGSALYMAMVMALIYGLTNLTVSKYAWIILVISIMIGILFVRVELKAKDPLIRITMFSNDSVFTLSNLAALLNYGATFAVSYLLSIYLQLVAGYSSQTAGLILIFQPVVMAVLSPWAGKLSDRIEPLKLATAGMTICTTGLLIFIKLGEGFPLYVLIGNMVFMGVGFALFTSPNTKAIMSRVAPEDYAVANSITATMRNLGQSFSMAVVTIIMGVVLGSSTLQAVSKGTLIHAMRVAFVVFVVFSLVAVFMSAKCVKSNDDK